LDAVTVTTNDAEHLERLLACRPLVSSFDRLIVVDNASTDGSAELASRAGAVVVPRHQRGGYGPCVNQGARQAAGAALAVLNPDIVFESDDVVARLAAGLARSGVGLIAPALVLPGGRVQDSARHIPTPLDLLLRRLVSPQRGAIREQGEVPWVVGACFIVRREAWDAVGGFDERYSPLYFEDVDLCWRLRKAGWSTYLDSSVRVRHEHQAGSRRALWAPQTRWHLAGAARFYRDNPRFLLTRSMPRRLPPAER
jgi:GT2 family glycosyltransferase